MGRTSIVSDQAQKNKAPDQLVYLEDIHIFGLANLLKRTIIVTALDKIKDLQVINMRGVYLPILNSPHDCILEPILIAFHNFHFCPLLYTNDYNDDDLNTNLNDFLVLDDEHNPNETIAIDRNEPKSSTCKTYTYFPLVYSNFESMKVHFVTQSEEKNVSKHLQNYLKIVEIPVKSVVTSENGDRNEYVMPVLGCKIGKFFSHGIV
jgi:hypothetical protein